MNEILFYSEVFSLICPSVCYLCYEIPVCSRDFFVRLFRVLLFPIWYEYNICLSCGSEGKLSKIYSLEMCNELTNNNNNNLTFPFSLCP